MIPVTITDNYILITSDEEIKKEIMLHVHPLNDTEPHDLEGTQCKCNQSVIIEPNVPQVYLVADFENENFKIRTDEQ